MTIADASIKLIDTSHGMELTRLRLEARLNPASFMKLAADAFWAISMPLAYFEIKAGRLWNLDGFDRHLATGTGPAYREAANYCTVLLELAADASR